MGRKKGSVAWNRGHRVGDEARFFAKVMKTDDGCWLWMGFRWKSGYPRFWADDPIGVSPKRDWRAHRWAYLRFRGPIPEGLQPDHLCRNPGCVNPWHLEAVSARENTLRGNTVSGNNARKVVCLKGHSLGGENLYMTPDGRRQCRVCGAERGKRAVERRSIARQE
jgi:hypothetical protein